MIHMIKHYFIKPSKKTTINKNPFIPETDSNIIKNVLLIIGIALIYFIIGRLSTFLIFEPEGIVVIWPASGIFLSTVLLVNKKLRPFLHSYPMTIKNLEFGISSDYKEFEVKSKDSISINYAFCINGIIYYESNDENDRLQPVHKETYEEALKIVNTSRKESDEKHSAESKGKPSRGLS